MFDRPVWYDGRQANRESAGWVEARVMLLLEIAALIVIALWGLVATGKLIRVLSGIDQTLQEIRAVLQNPEDRPDA